VRRTALLLLLAAVALAGCGANETAAPETTDTGDVEELTNALDLRSAFEADAGKTRLVFLLSPT
jgi:ABC-type glycerol-3-phosphate transport system substrate-binding protein